MWIHALTIFAGAFLLFQVQPVIAKFILPWFGGSAAVWTTCMLFFQLFLVAGYAYAHASCRWLGPRTQALVHIMLVTAAAAVLPIVPAASWKPSADAEPISAILLLLTACLGLPYFVLASTGPLVQAWFARRYADVAPYRLYALSNAGSFLALLSYPFLVEPVLTRQTQALAWAIGFGIFGALSAISGLMQWRRPRPTPPVAPEPLQNPSAIPDRAIPRLLVAADDRDPVLTQACTVRDPARSSVSIMTLWLALPACGSVLLLATNNKLCEEVAAVPFLWVMPLAVYLLTFVLTFERSAWYARPAFTCLLAPVLAAWCAVLASHEHLPFEWQIAVYLAGLFVTCMICHGEVYRLRPPPEHLTAFYLAIAIGGALGGIAVAAVAPLVLRLYSELLLGLLFLVALLVWIHFREGSFCTLKNTRLRAWPAIAVGLVVLIGFVTYQLRATMADTLLATRNFYGVMRVTEIADDDPDYHARMLIHGTTNHGLQFLAPEKSNLPTMYFNEPSGVGLTLAYLRARGGPLRIGVLGLGVGTLASYAEEGDTLRIYELDPQVVTVARSHFTYLEQCKATVEIVLGDGRSSLEREKPQEFDILVLDAFSGDSPPTHLLTREAFDLYLRHVKAHGVIAVNTSNRYLDFFPVVLAAAEYHGVGMIFVPWNETPMPLGYASSMWILVSRNSTFLRDEDVLAHARRPFFNSSLVPVPWTDDYASLFKIMVQ